ncbi:MAG: 3-deoxy-7-phosphoheptulonate synthase [Chloroflexi bacterium]|nr:3-deoxy-7-phosphoheptulonate synthase [Chloroflexota bacterium]
MINAIASTPRSYQLAAREAQLQPTTIRIGEAVVGGGVPTVIAGPCAVESEGQLLLTARAVAEAGAHLLRGGAYKPRTSPYAFRGLGLAGLELLALARETTGLPFCTEVVDTRDVEIVARYADVLQIGARNMHNSALLEEAGRSGKPVILKRGLSATVEEWLLAAEYILATGNPNVILCERGIRTYETATRNTLDLNAVALVKQRSHLPVLVDPSHGTGKWYLVQPLALAGLTAGADGLMVEVHHDPDRATSDGPQSLTHAHFAQLMEQVGMLSPLLAQLTHREPVT